MVQFFRNPLAKYSWNIVILSHMTFLNTITIGHMWQTKRHLNKVDRSHNIKCALLYALYVLHYLIMKLCFTINYTYPHSSIQKLSALLLMYKCWYIPCHEMDGLLCHLCLFWQAVLLLRWCVFIILPTSAMYNDQKLVEVV